MISRIFRYTFLRPLGLDRETSPILLLLLLFGVAIGSGLWLFNGDVPITAAVLYFIMITIVMFLRPDIGLYIFFMLVLLFDQLQLTGFAPITYEVEFFRNLKEITYLPEIPMGGMNPVEVHLALLCFSWFILFCLVPDMTFRPIPVLPAFLLFGGWFAFSLVYGMYRGGDMLVALWEIRAIVYMSVLYLIVPQIIRDKKQIYIIVWIIITAITIKAIQGLIRFVSLGFSMEEYEALTSNEEPVLMVLLFIFFMALWVFKIHDVQRSWLTIFLPLILLGFYAGQRRASFASMMVTFVAFILLLPRGVQLNFLKRMAPILIVLLAYGGVFWNSDSPLAGPVQMVKSGIVTPSKEENMRDYHSNLYRDIENYNLSVTAKQHPVMGVGFGNQYEMPLELVNISFPLRDYIPHNQIFWVYVKTGVIGFMLFWYFFNSVAYRGVNLYMRLRDPYLKVIALMIVIGVLNQMVVSYFDVMLTFYRNMILLGVLMGLLPALEAHAREEEQQEEE